jgi:hypothetical protein
MRYFHEDTSIYLEFSLCLRKYTEQPQRHGEDQEPRWIFLHTRNRDIMPQQRNDTGVVPYPHRYADYALDSFGLASGPKGVRQRLKITPANGKKNPVIESAR